VQKKAEVRRLKHLENVARGSNLQSVAYAIAASAVSGHGAEGRFVHLGTDLEGDARVFSSRSDDEEFTEAFGDTAARVLEAWDRGSFFPRLVEGERRTEPRLCEFCDVKDACVRGDSGARGRLVRWVDDRNAEAMRKPSERRDDAPELALLGIFNLRGGGS
jgi:hypothetical protein